MAYSWYRFLPVYYSRSLSLIIVAQSPHMGPRESREQGFRANLTWIIFDFGLFVQLFESVRKHRVGYGSTSASHLSSNPIPSYCWKSNAFQALDVDYRLVSNRESFFRSMRMNHFVIQVAQFISLSSGPAPSIKIALLMMEIQISFCFVVTCHICSSSVHVNILLWYLNHE